MLNKAQKQERAAARAKAAASRPKSRRFGRSHRRRALDAFLAALAANGNDLARTADSRHTPPPSGP